MSLTETEYQQLILAEVGDTAEGLIAGMVPVLWAEFADLAAVPRLRKLAAKIRAIDILRSALRELISRVMTEDERKTLQMRLDQLTLAREGAVDELSEARLTSEAGAGTAGFLQTQRALNTAGAEYRRPRDTPWPLDQSWPRWEG